MTLTRLILVLFLLGSAPLSLWAASAEGESQGLPSAAPVLLKVGWFQVSNSMVLTWIVAAALILFARRATRAIRQVPEGSQNFAEWLVESLHEFLEGIIGHDLVRKTFWFFATIFIFILFTNWFGLIPGVGSIGWGHPNESGSLHHLSEPLFRGANADMNMTLAMSMVFFVCWTVWALQANGPGGFILHLFGPKGDTAGLLKLLMIFVFVMVGLLGSGFDPVPPGIPEFSVIRQHLRRREHARDHGADQPLVRLVGRHSVLLSRGAGRLGPGAGVHVVDGRLHAAHL